jgi:hypothetical protein
MAEQTGRDPPQPVLIAQGLGKGGSVLQGDKGPLELAQEPEHIAQVEVEIDGLCLGVRARWEPL